MAISVFLLDDHEVVRRGLEQLLTAEPDIEEAGVTAILQARRRCGRRGHGMAARAHPADSFGLRMAPHRHHELSGVTR